jgi:hypothetical protein
MAPSISTIKTLFALSCNRCAFPACEEVLANPGWTEVKADIAHIKGAQPGSARHDPTMTGTDRDRYENLMLLCPNHHRLIDCLEPDQYPVSRLLEIKQRAEDRCGGAKWASDDELHRYATLGLAAIAAEQPDTRPHPRLVVAVSPAREVTVENVGDADADRVTVNGVDEMSQHALVAGLQSAARLPPGGVTRVGLYARTFGNPGPHAVVVTYVDKLGGSYESTFPL